MARPRVRNRILEAAHELFKSGGAAALTTRAVAERAGVTEASVFNNFGDKTRLIHALIHETLPQLNQLMDCIRAEPDCIEKWLEQFFNTAVDYFLVILPLTSPYLREPPKQPRQDQAKGFYTPRLALVDRLSEFQESGLCPRNMNTALVAKMLMGTAMHSAITRITLNDSDEDAPVNGRELASTLGLL